MAARSDKLVDNSTERPNPEMAKYFPSGSKGLVRQTERGTEVMKDEEKVRLVNLALAPHRLILRDESRVPDGKMGFFEATRTIKPFETFEVPVLYAKRIFAGQEKPGAIISMVLVPPDGDCGGKMSFVDFGGKTFQTCSYSNCKTHGAHNGFRTWSIVQAQHLIKTLGTEAAIQRFIIEIDGRTEVIIFGLASIADRKEARAKRMGTSTTSKNNKAVF